MNAVWLRYSEIKYPVVVSSILSEISFLDLKVQALRLYCLNRRAPSVLPYKDLGNFTAWPSSLYYQWSATKRRLSGLGTLLR